MREMTSAEANAEYAQAVKLAAERLSNDYIVYFSTGAITYTPTQEHLDRIMRERDEHDRQVTDETPSALSILDAAMQAIDRQAATRDRPGGERSMQRVVDAFNGLTGRDLSVTEGWLFMVQLKAVRMLTTSSPDTAADMAAYAALAGESRA